MHQLYQSYFFFRNMHSNMNLVATPLDSLSQQQHTHISSSLGLMMTAKKPSKSTSHLKQMMRCVLHGWTWEAANSMMDRKEYHTLPLNKWGYTFYHAMKTNQKYHHRIFWTFSSTYTLHYILHGSYNALI